MRSSKALNIFKVGCGLSKTTPLLARDNGIRTGIKGPKVAVAPAPPSDSDMAKYAPLFKDFNTVSRVWEAPNLTEAWRILYEELQAVEPAERSKIRATDGFGLARLSSNLEISRILLILPNDIREAISKHEKFKLSELEEIFVHCGMHVEARGGDWVHSVPIVATVEDIKHIQKRLNPFGSDGRASLPGTLHRISAYKSKEGNVIGLTIRIGKYISNAAIALMPVVRRGSLLILSRPAVGKTTLLRDLAARLSQEASSPRVVVIDTSCEVGGDGESPLPFMHRVRRVLVNDRANQSKAMLDALQNHSPDYIIVDEVANQAEAEAAYTISQRGVKLIATCHAESLQSLLQNSAINRLVGGVAQAFLSNEERRLKGKIKKTVLERPVDSPFPFVLEINQRSQGFLSTNVNKVVDHVLDDQDPKDLVHHRFPIMLETELPQRVFKAVKSSVGGMQAEASKKKPSLLQGKYEAAEGTDAIKGDNGRSRILSSDGDGGEDSPFARKDDDDDDGKILF